MQLAIIFRSLTRSLIQRNSRRLLSSRISENDFSISEDQVETEDVESFKTSLDDETRGRLENILAEYEIFKYSDSRMPSKLNVKHLQRLLLHDSKAERIRYLTHLYRVEEHKRKDETKKYENVQERIELARNEILRQRQQHIYYGVGGSSIFQRILESNMNRYYNNRLMKAMMFGPNLILDMSYLPLMKMREATLTAKQVVHIHHENRLHRSPHHLILTGCKMDHVSWDDVGRHLTGHEISRFYTVTEKHYLDLFPKEQLVYLTPDAKIALTEYDPTKTYIMAAYVDLISRPNLTLGRAKEEGIEARRLPLERCIRLIGRKALCLNHVVGIMNDACTSGSITFGIMNNIPRHKTVGKSTGTKIVRKKRHEYERQRLQYLQLLGSP